jgi:hypothetical protein
VVPPQKNGNKGKRIYLIYLKLIAQITQRQLSDKSDKSVSLKKIRFFRVQKKSLRPCAFALKTLTPAFLPCNSLPNSMQLPFFTHSMERTCIEFGSDLKRRSSEGEANLKKS